MTPSGDGVLRLVIELESGHGALTVIEPRLRRLRTAAGSTVGVYRKAAAAARGGASCLLASHRFGGAPGGHVSRLSG